jgi:hypothetical protein
MISVGISKQQLLVRRMSLPIILLMLKDLGADNDSSWDIRKMRRRLAHRNCDGGGGEEREGDFYRPYEMRATGQRV